jgi:hypothetical protein
MANVQRAEPGARSREARHWFSRRARRGAARTAATMSKDHSSQAAIEIRFVGFTSADVQHVRHTPISRSGAGEKG